MLAVDRGTDVAPDGVAAIEEWTAGYVRRHPLASLTTVGEQYFLAVRTIQYFFVDLFTGRFQCQTIRWATTPPSSTTRLSNGRWTAAPSSRTFRWQH